MTIQQVERFIKKIAQKFPAQPSNEENAVLTDIHVRVSQDSGELLAFDDDDTEITRCVVEQWKMTTRKTSVNSILPTMIPLFWEVT